MTELLLDTPLNEEQLNMAFNVNNSADSLLTIINDILDHSKIEAGKLSIRNISFNLVSLVEDTFKVVNIKASQKRLNLLTSIDPGIPPVLSGDPVRLRQVLLNLTSNAIKFTEYGQVVLSVFPDSENDSNMTLRFEVADTGIGMSDEEQKKIFKPFFQVNGSLTRKYGGTGLGLSISKQLVDIMGGRIGMGSREGDGSTFWFTVPFGKCPPSFEPADAAAQSGKQDKEAVSTGPGDNGRLILLAEDNPVNRKLTQLQLNKLGYAVNSVTNGQEAVEAVKEGKPYSLILMDCQMPVMDGLEAARTIRRNRPAHGGRIPIIALTAHAMRGDREQCLAAGMDDYLSKPVKLHQLRQIINRWIPVSETDSYEAPPVGSQTLKLSENDSVDMEVLESLRGLQPGAGDSILKEFIRIYLEDTPSRIEDMRQAVERADPDGLTFAAHSLKSSSANIGARRLSAMAKELELMGRLGNIGGSAEKLKNIGEEYDKVRTSLEAIF